MNRNNCIAIRVCGDSPCFARLETKVELGSYAIITPSAARGVLEAIVWEPPMYYVIGTIAVLK